MSNFNSFSSQWLLLKTKIKDRQDKENQYIKNAANPKIRAMHENALDALFKVEEDMKWLESSANPEVIDFQTAHPQPVFGSQP